VSRGEKGIVEEVRDVEEFLRLLDPESRVHYELYWKAVEYSRTTGLIYRMEAGMRLYGISREGFILVCNLSEVISWDDERLRKYGNSNLFEDYNAWIKERWKEYEKIAKELGATPGKFQLAVIS